MPSPTQRNRDLACLHPLFRAKAQTLLQRLAAEGLGFQLFEGYRSPHRQKFLYSQGRTRPGAIVTHAQPWTSYHQFGLAADFVWFDGANWSWDDSGAAAARWTRLHELAAAVDLEPLSFEKPHLQVAGLSIASLRAGNYPAGGDESWAQTMEDAIASWEEEPPAPPVPGVLPQRPPVVPEMVFVNRFGGREWCVTSDGVVIRENGATRLLRTDGQPVTVRKILELYEPLIRRLSDKHGVPAQLLIMTIATETAFARQQGFTGPVTFRWEPAVKVSDAGAPRFGDYSAGPCQLLGTTARALIRKNRLPMDPFSVAPAFERRPEPPAALALYDPAVNLELSALCIKEGLRETQGDPVLVAARYNSGGLRKSSGNPWRLACHGDHLDRAARWYGDACAVYRAS
ncbi:MAG: D-alanyl-D-alanine carboxypeptidase family protein [Bryobacteraceae bacterium]|nr:D-alanyl-D-alanine carboxypeptidase family protein [Bryobacteraceae bacterium]